MRMKLAFGTAIVAAMCVAGGLRPIDASANGSTLKLHLWWLPKVCNCGSDKALGEVQVNVGEGYIDLVATGLAPLEGGAYEVWLVTPGLGQWVSMGRFSIGSEDEAHYTAVLERTPVLDYRYVLVTQEPEPDTDADPSGCVVLGAVFPDREAVRVPSSTAGEGVGQAQPSPTAAQDQAGTQAAQGSPPLYLPETGANPVEPADVVGLASLMCAIMIAAQRSRARRKQE